MIAHNGEKTQWLILDSVIHPFTKGQILLKKHRPLFDVDLFILSNIPSNVCFPMRSFLKWITQILNIILNQTLHILFHFLICLGNSEVLVMDLGFNTSGWSPCTFYFPTETQSLCHVTDPNLIDSYAFSYPMLPSPLNSLCCKHTAEPLCRSVTQTHTKRGLSESIRDEFCSHVSYGPFREISPWKFKLFKNRAILV